MCHPLLHDSGCGLGYDASRSLGFDRLMALVRGGPSNGTWFHNEGTHATSAFRRMGSANSDAITEHQYEQTRPSLVFKDVICGWGRCAILFFSPG